MRSGGERPDAVDAETWKNAAAAAASAGVLVFNYDCPGLYRALDAHVDVTCAVSKFVPPYSVAWRRGATRRRTGTARR